MAGLKLSNNATSTLASGITDVATSLTLAAGDGNLKFPTLAAGEYFYAYLIQTDNDYEIVKVTARSGDVLTIDRAEQGTTGLAFSTGDVVSARLTATDINAFPTPEDIQNSAHTYTGTVGGTADVITLTPDPAWTAYAAGQQIWWITSGANTTNVTVNVSSLGAKALTKNGTTALVANDLPSGALVGARYDGTRLQLLSLGAATVPSGALPLTGGTMTGDITMSGASIIQAEGAAITAAATTEIWTTDGDTAHITGNTGISSFGTAAQAGMRKLLIIDGTPLLTHGANLNLPGSVDYQCVADDILDVYADTTTQHDVRVFKQSLSGGRSVVFANGTKSSGTFTPVPANGEMQSYTNGGAHTLAPPALSGAILMTITNDASAGAITTSGFGDVFGDAFTTTDAHIFLCLIIYDGTNSVLKVKALQ